MEWLNQTTIYVHNFLKPYTIIKGTGMEVSDTQLNEKCMQEKYMQQNPIFL